MAGLIALSIFIMCISGLGLAIYTTVEMGIAKTRMYDVTPRYAVVHAKRYLMLRKLRWCVPIAPVVLVVAAVLAFKKRVIDKNEIVRKAEQILEDYA